MTQLGEAVAIGIVLDSKLECPFHENSHQHDGTASNYQAGDASKLGKNLAAGNAAASTVRRDAKPDKEHRGPRKEADPDDAFTETEREVQIVKGNDDCIYPVAHSAHHLIPAKESLNRATALHKFIDKAKGHICCHLGYDVDGNENGVWLPGLHAVNSKGLDLWGAASTDLPDEEDVGRKVVQRAELEDRKTKWSYSPLDGPRPGVPGAFEPTNMKWLYVQKAMTFPRLSPRQFHDRHVDYSGKVKDHLNSVAGVMERFRGTVDTQPTCAKCAEAQGKPAPPPAGLLGLLNNSSRWYRGRLVGRTRDAEYFTSSWCGPDAPPLILSRKRKRRDSR